jgi:hypothetical protein
LPHREEFHDAEESPVGAVASGASHAASNVMPVAGPVMRAVGYGVGAAGRTLLGLTYQGAKGLVSGIANASYEHEPESNEAVMVPRPVRGMPRMPERPADLPPELPPLPNPEPAGEYQHAVPAYLLDRESATPHPRKSFVQKERDRIRNEAQATGVHPFHPWRTHRGY